MARTNSGTQSWDTGRNQEMRIMVPNVANYTGTFHTPLGNNSGAYSFAFVGPLGVGQQVYFQQWQNSGYTIDYDAGFWDVVFVPTDGYP